MEQFHALGWKYNMTEYKGSRRISWHQRSMSTRNDSDMHYSQSVTNLKDLPFPMSRHQSQYRQLEITVT
jgi:hypothetical protein